MSHACYVCNYAPVPDGEGVECPHCHRLQYATMCPHCGQNAPTIIRGMKVYCSACNQARGPLSGGMPLNIVGQPQRWGSTLASFAGWGTILAALLVSGVLGSLVAWLLGATAGLVVGGGLGLLGVFVGVLMLLGGRKLRSAGEQDVAHAREQAIFGLAANRGGALTATDVAAALNVPAKQADAMLTAMARDGTRVGVEVDGAGVVHYVFPEVRLRGQPAPGVRVAPATGVRVDAGAAPSPSPSASAGSADADAIKAQVDREWQQLQNRNRG